MTKNHFRKIHTALRAKLTAKEVDEFSLEIANKSLQLPIWDHTTYHVFLPIVNKNEVNTEYLLHILQGKDKSVIVSKANFETLGLTHYLLQENTSFLISDYGIPEPISGIEITSKQIDVVFVPLLAFDLKGNRLGYGKGFYDRFFAECKADTIFVGLSFFKAETKIPSILTDIPLHFCVTPQKVYIF